MPTKHTQHHSKQIAGDTTQYAALPRTTGGCSKFSNRVTHSGEQHPLTSAGKATQRQTAETKHWRQSTML